MKVLKNLNGIKTINKEIQKTINGGGHCVCPSGTCGLLDIFTGNHLGCVPC